MSTSVIDYIFRELAVTYLGRHDLAHVEPGDIQSKVSKGIVKKLIEPEYVSEEVVSERLVELDKSNKPDYESYNYNLSSKNEYKNVTKSNSITSKVRQAIEKGYTGDICSECQSMTMVRNGTCLKCMTCGSTSGCS